MLVVLNVGNEETYSNGNVAMIRMLKLIAKTIKMAKHHCLGLLNMGTLRW